MTSSFNWDSLQGIDTNITTATSQVNQDEGFSWEAMEGIKEKTKAKQAAEVGIESIKGLGRIGARGAASLLSAPAKGIGGLLQLLSQLGEEGKPGEVKGAGTRTIKNIGDWFQRIGSEGQEQLKTQIESLLGTPYGSGEEALSGLTERIADIYGRGPFKGMVAPSIAGGAAGEAVKQLGGGEQAQQIAEIGGIFGPSIVKGLPNLIKKPITSKSGLNLPKIAEETSDKLRGIKPKVLRSRKEELYKNVSDQSENLIGKIKVEKLPLSKEIEEGVDVVGRTQKNLEKVNKIASKMTNKIEPVLISDYLNEIENKIQFGGVPTGEQNDILKLVDKYKEKFGELQGGTRFYTPSQYLKQFRNINKDLNNLYQTKFVHGERLDTMRFYEGLKGEITKTLEEGTPESFTNLFKEANKDFSQVSRIERFDKIMESVTDNGIINANKLNSYISNPKKANVLQKQIGKQGFDKLRLISKDLSKVQNKLKLVGELGLPEIIKSSLTYGALSWLGVPKGIMRVAAGGKKLAELGRGYMLTSPQGARDVSNFLKAVQSGSKKAIRSYLLKMDRNAKKHEDSKNPK